MALTAISQQLPMPTIKDTAPMKATRCLGIDRRPITPSRKRHTKKKTVPGRHRQSHRFGDVQKIGTSMNCVDVSKTTILPAQGQDPFRFAGKETNCETPGPRKDRQGSLLRSIDFQIRLNDVEDALEVNDPPMATALQGFWRSSANANMVGRPERPAREETRGES
jgi:hypothetical protein